MNFKCMNLEHVLSRFFDLAREFYKEAATIRQKLVEVEILDLSDAKVYSFFSDINRFLPPSTSISPFSCGSKVLLKLKENSTMMDSKKLIESGFDNIEIFPRFLELLKQIEPFSFYLLSKRKNELIELYCFDTKRRKIDTLLDNLPEEGVNKREYLFFVLGDINPDYDFKKTMDFFKIWSIFNGDINLIVKNFSRKQLKTLLKLDFPLLSCEIVKLFQVQTVFSLFSDSDCLLINILEEQNYEFSSNVFVNTLQFFNPLNFEESLFVFGRLFSFDNRGTKLSFELGFEGDNAGFKVELIMGTSSKLSETMFVFGFWNRTVMFERLSGFNKVENFFNDVLNRSIEGIEMRKYGYAAFFEKNEINDSSQTDFFKKLFLKKLFPHKKVKNYAIFLAINLNCKGLNMDEYFSDLDKLNKLEECLSQALVEQISSLFEQHKKENEFQVLMSSKERRTLESFNNDVPRIAQSLENISQSLKSSFGSLLGQEIVKIPAKLEIQKKLWEKIVFE